MSLFSNAISGLNAAQLGLTTTQHNINNVNTVGFSRQNTTQATNIALGLGSGYVGNGVHVETIKRSYNDFIVSQVNQAQTSSSELEAYFNSASMIDNMLADPDAGLSPPLQEFFKGVQQVAANPAAMPNRDSLIAQAQTLIARFNSMEQRLADIYSGINDQIMSSVDMINTLAVQIGEVNQSIAVAGAALGQPPNDLLDQRDLLISQLNKEIRVTTNLERDGTLTVFIGSGQQLVIGPNVNQLKVVPMEEDSQRMGVALVSQYQEQELPESVLTGGALGGALNFRRETLDEAANTLGVLAGTLALTFNSQQALGQDLIGNKSGDANFQSDFFNVPAPAVISSSGNSAGAGAMTAELVSPAPMRYNSGEFAISFIPAGSTHTNAGQYVVQQFPAGTTVAFGADFEQVLQDVKTATGKAIDLSTGNFFTNLKASDYELQANGGGNFTLIRLSDRTTLTGAGGETIQAINDKIATSEGFMIDPPTGAPLAGDSYIIKPTRELARNIELNPTLAADPRLLAGAWPVRTDAAIANTGEGKIEVIGQVPNRSLAASYTLSYNETTNQLSGFPAGSNITVTDNAGNVTGPTAAPGPITYTSNALITVDGVTFRIRGTLKNGDQFTVAPNTNAVSDGRNILALGALQTQDTVAGGKTSIQGGYAQLVTDVGATTRQAKVTHQAQETLLGQAQAARESISGVNLDEEAANLIKFQQAYQASARVINIASRLFDEIVSIGR